MILFITYFLIASLAMTKNSDFNSPISIGKNKNIGGESEIRTHGGLTPSTVFKTAAFGRSAISPWSK
jgi:hypothetical protein